MTDNKRLKLYLRSEKKIETLKKNHHFIGQTDLHIKELHG
jgi:hypothetical protein